MTDRELLELAVKAAGIKIDKSPYNGGGSGNDGFDIAGNAVLDWHNGKTWNPLTDDGDALRLAVKLNMNIFVEYGAQRSFADAGDTDPGIDDENCESWMPDKAEAVRRAIVRAAAEIGRQS